MTDNEIIKALECCTQNGDFTKTQIEICSPCPYVNCGDCTGVLKADALDLINRQQAEIENLKDILYDAEGVNLVNYWHQQCGIAENACRNFDEENKKLKAEVERLKGWQDLLKAEKHSLIKAEAVKEFADKVLLYIPNIEGDTTIKCVEEAIKQTLKETVGGADG